MKKALALVLALVMCLSLVACGGSKTEAPAANNAPAANDAPAAAPADGAWAPKGTVQIVVPAGAGGNTDLSARVFAQYASKLTGADFVVINAGGASGSVAANQVLDAPADGQTFLYGHALVNVANISGISDYNYTAFKLGPNFAKDPAQQLYVNPNKYPTTEAFIEAAKANPGKLQACTEVGAYTYYELLAFEEAAGIDLDLVDVGSNSDKIAAMLSQQVDLMPGAYINTKDYIESGDFMALGAPTAERYELISDMPTLKEQGIDLVYPDCDFSFYFPADTSDEVIAFYEQLVQDILADPEAAEAVAGVQMMPYYMSAAECAENEAWIYDTIKAIADRLGA